MFKEEENVMELDPIQFLAQGDSDDESENEDDDQIVSKNGNDRSILTSLGLQHVNSGTPYGSLAVRRHSISIVYCSSSNGNLILIFAPFSLLEL